MTHNNMTHTLRTCNNARWLGAALLLSLLSACGADGEDESVPATPSAVLTAGTGTTSPTVPGTSNGANLQTAATTCSITAFQVSVLAEINRRRASAQSCGTRGTFAATGALRWSNALFGASAGHARDMVANNFFSHTGANGSSVGDRLNAIAYSWASVAENIAAGQPTVTRVVDAWMNSDGHCANVMNPAMEEVAVACVYNTVNRSNYWVMDVAKPR